MKKRRIFALILSLVVATSCLTACGSKNANSDKADGETKEESKATTAPAKEEKKEETAATEAPAKEDVITVLVPPVTNTYLEKIKTYAEEFHTQYPNLTMEIIETSWDSHKEKLQTMSLAGEAPDIAEVSYSMIGTLVEMGVAIDITKHMSAERLADYDQNALDYMTLEGTTYGLPLYITIQAIGANKEKLVEAGVDVAKVQQNGWTYDEFVEAIKNGTKDDCFGFVFASSAVTAADYLSVFGVSAGLTNSFTSDLKYAYTSQNMLKLLEAVQEMSASGYTPNYGVDASQRMVMCQTGNAMIFGKAMPLFEGNINKNNAAIDAKDGTAVEGSIKLEYVFLPVPTMEGMKESCFGSVDGLVALKNADTTDEHLDNVMLALDFLCSGDRAAATDAELYLDAVCQTGRDAMSKYVVEGRDAANLACAARSISLVVAPPTGITAEMSNNANTIMTEFIAPKFQALLAGEVTAQVMYDDICSEAKELFGEENCEMGYITQ